MIEPVQYIFYCRPSFTLWVPIDGPVEPGDTSECPDCGAVTTAEEYRDWMTKLVAAHAAGLSEESRLKMSEASRTRPHTGPTTPEGKRRCSINALKHGGTAKLHRTPPARPGQYHDCLTCEFAPPVVNPPQKFELSSIVQGEKVSRDIPTGGDDSCSTKKFLYCVKQGEVLLQVANANGPDDLRSLIRAAQGYAVLNLTASLRQIAQDGPTVESAIIKLDKEGNVLVVGTELRPHPALKSVEVHGRALGDGLSLSEAHLTPKSQKQDENGQGLVSAVTALNELLYGRSDAGKPTGTDEPDTDT
jgi:hypothetical protein